MIKPINGKNVAVDSLSKFTSFILVFTIEFSKNVDFTVWGDLQEDRPCLG